MIFYFWKLSYKILQYNTLLEILMSHPTTGWKMEWPTLCYRGSKLADLSHIFIRPSLATFWPALSGLQKPPIQNISPVLITFLRLAFPFFSLFLLLPPPLLFSSRHFFFPSPVTETPAALANKMAILCDKRAQYHFVNICKISLGKPRKWCFCHRHTCFTQAAQAYSLCLPSRCAIYKYKTSMGTPGSVDL